MELFSFPAVYDTAFQFRDAQKTVDFIEWSIKTYAGIPVCSIVDIACGTGHFTREIARRNYRTYGVDLNSEVCRYAEYRAHNEALDIRIIPADMAYFSLPEPCDLAVNFFDSITYLADLQALSAHFTTVSRELRPGGLYIVEFGVIDSFDNHNVEEVWTEIRRDFSVTTTYFRDSWINPSSNTFEEQCSFRARCREHVAFFQVRFRKLALYFDEFERLVKQTGCFTPLGYYDDFDPEAEFDEDLVPWRVIAVLKRR